VGSSQKRLIVVIGATGLQGGAVARKLLADGWPVRALTRQPSGPKAQALAERGAEIAQGDTADPASLRPVFADAYGVYNVQNAYLSGVDGEIQQGRNVADAARQAGVQHVVYGSAGTSAAQTGVPSWDAKRAVEAHLKALGLPLTILRPTAFMELMTHPKFFPHMSTWQVMPALMGSNRPVVWLCTGDLAEIAAHAFAEPERYVGRDLALASDVQTLEQCRQIYIEELGRRPPRFPLPPWVFKRFGLIGQDLSRMWTWLRDHEIPLDTKPTRAIHPEAHTVRSWLRAQRQL
jgi:uncharacterized protein YbjT (DUF2867 family)